MLGMSSWSSGSAVKSIACSPKGPEFDSRQPSVMGKRGGGVQRS